MLKTNHHWRPFMYRYEVPTEVLADQFSYQDPDEVLDGFFRYRGNWYHLDQFVRSNTVPDWHGYHGDSFFSGIAIAIAPDGEAYRIATVLE